jgi:hypothetical protein
VFLFACTRSVPGLALSLGDIRYTTSKFGGRSVTVLFTIKKFRTSGEAILGTQREMLEDRDRTFYTIQMLRASGQAI